MPQSPLIMIIRHGEKPTDELAGIHPNGDKSDNCLIARGWQRSGALVPFFAHPTNEKLQTPTLLIAANREAPGADPKERSLREVQTLAALSGQLKKPLDLSCGKGMEAQAAKLAVEHTGPVLLCWDHHKIPELARHISSNQDIPAEWDSNRFDMIFVFRSTSTGNAYTFEQVPQLLLPGDLATPMP